MKTMRDLLRSADPLGYEAPWSPQQRHLVEQYVLASAPPVNAWSRRRLLGGLGAALAAGAVVAASRFSLYAAVRLEVRLAETEPAPGLIPAAGDVSSRMIYLHPDSVAENADIATATAVAADNAFRIDITFNPRGANKMFAATSGHLGKPIAILIDGQVVAAPTVRSPIRGAAQINGNFTRAEAERIATGMIGK